MERWHDFPYPPCLNIVYHCEFYEIALNPMNKINNSNGKSALTHFFLSGAEFKEMLIFMRCISSEFLRSQLEVSCVGWSYFPSHFFSRTNILNEHFEKFYVCLQTLMTNLELSGSPMPFRW